MISLVHIIEIAWCGSWVVHEGKKFSSQLHERVKGCWDKTEVSGRISEENKKLAISSYSFICTLVDCITLANRLTIISLGRRIKIVSGIGCACRGLLSALTCWDDRKILNNYTKNTENQVIAPNQEELHHQKIWTLINITMSVIFAVWAAFNFATLLIVDPELTALIYFFGSCTIGVGEIAYRCSIEKAESALWAHSI